jgi:hypothetical protein
VAWSLLAVFAAGFAAVPLSVANGNFQREPSFNVALALAFTAFMVVGAVVVTHRPGNAVGWVFSAVGLVASSGVLAMEYAEFALFTRPGSLPGAMLAAWYQWWWLPLLGLIFIFTPLLFPTGRLPSPRWRPLAAVAAGTIVAVIVLAALQPTLRLQNEDLTVRNPIGVAGVPDPEESALGGLFLVVFLVCSVAAVASVVLRFRRSRGVERQQLKWFTYAALVMFAVNLATMFLPGGAVGDLLFGLAIAFLPVAAGIAILRHRLYDIDRLINRTVVYLALTALLGAVYAAVVLVVGLLFGRVDEETPSWAVAGATLAVAALFQPARRRIQAVVDRRFDRRSYDAARTAEAFGVRLRDQVDLDTLSVELLAVVDQTVQPTRLSLWLRQPTARR